MNEEYTYNIGKYTIGVDTNGEDGIGLTVAIISDDGEIHLLGNCYGDNARCIDFLIKENQQLKEHLERYEIIIFNLKEQLKTSEKARKDAIELIKEKQRKDEFLELNEWQTRDLLSILDIDKGE